MNVETAITTIDLMIPRDWIRLEPPDDASAAAVAPNPTNGFHANIVMNCVPTPNGTAIPSTAALDAYLIEVIGSLQSALIDSSIEAVWVSRPDEADARQQRQSQQPQQPQQQRLMVGHTVAGIAVDMVQHHTWFDDVIVVITATMAANPDPDAIEMLDRCLLSAAWVDGNPATIANFDDWEPVTPRVWTPAPNAERIAHL